MLILLPFLVKQIYLQGTHMALKKHSMKPLPSPKTHKTSLEAVTFLVKFQNTLETNAEVPQLWKNLPVLAYFTTQLQESYSPQYSNLSLTTSSRQQNNFFHLIPLGWMVYQHHSLMVNSISSVRGSIYRVNNSNFF